ncbi:MAG: TonB-dependent receptor [Proteobacteria bacterium]|nr:TonB-dependent receptor [Pseudomonadota bacterium]
MDTIGLEGAARERVMGNVPAIPAALFSCIVFALAPDSAGSLAEEIEEISVTAVRRVVSGDSVTLSLDRAQDVLARQLPLITNALEDLPGVAVQQTTPGQGAAIVRGLKGSAVLHVVDGIRLNNALFRSAPTQYLALVSPSIVETVEVIRGSPASLYGSDAIGGVVYAVTRRPDPEVIEGRGMGEARASADSASRFRRLGLTYDAPFAAGFASISVDWSESGNRRTGHGERVPYTGYSSKAVRSLFGGATPSGGEWYLDLHFLEQPRTPRVDELVPGFGQSEPSSSEFSFNPNSRAFAHWHHDRRAGPFGLDWKMDWAWQRIVDDRTTRGFGETIRSHESNRSDLLGVSVSASRGSLRESWLVGTDIYYDEVQSSKLIEDLDTGEIRSGVSRFPDGSDVLQFSLFGNAAWRPVPRHSVSAGLRLTAVRTTLPRTPSSAGFRRTVRDASGDLGWSFEPATDWRLRSNVGFGFRAPNIFDLGTLGSRPGNRFNVPNPNLDSERVVHVDAGVDYRSVSAEFSLAVFGMRYRDKITTVFTGEETAEGRDTVTSANVGEAVLFGGEAGYRVSFGNWTVDGNLSYVRGSESNDDAASMPADRIPPLNGSLSLQFDPGTSAAWSMWVRFAGRQTRLSERDRRDSRIDPLGTPGWASIGTRLVWRPDDAWRLSFSVDNVLDRGYRVHGSGIDAPGANLAIEARYTWR